MEEIMREVTTVEDIEQIEKALGEARGKVSGGKTATLSDLAEIEKTVGEAKGRMLLEPSKGFWADKTACWEMCHCPEMIRRECPALTYQSVPCWEIEGTYCKLNDYGATGDDTTICQVCRVYKKYGNGEPIDIVLKGRGILEPRIKPIVKL